MPDITILPLLADYFKVSTDQLLGLKPLDGEKYIPEKTATKEFWNQKLEYLLRTRKSYWKDDYIRFLISQVWKIDKPISVLDCSCGYGFLGLLLLPYLPDGSSYTGIDFSEDLIKKGKALFENQKLEADFLCGNVFNYSVENQYDFVVCQAVLRHLGNSSAFIQKMIQFAKPDGYVVCIDANREFECCSEDIEYVIFPYGFHGERKQIFEQVIGRLREYGIPFEVCRIILKCGKEENIRKAINDGRNMERIERGIKNTSHFVMAWISAHNRHLRVNNIQFFISSLENANSSKEREERHSVTNLTT